MKKLIVLVLMFLPMAGTIFAQQTRTGGIGINLSLWKNISTQRIDTVGSTWFNAGILSAMNRLNGLGMNIFGSVVRTEVNGIQLSGLANITGESMHGMQLAGITNINGNGLAGVSISGLVGIAGNQMQGIAASGLANIAGEESKGMLAGGLLNVSGNQSIGIHVAGLADITGNNFQGLSIAGLLNLTGGNQHGTQLAGLVNITAGDAAGMQLAGISNVTGGNLHGVQLGGAGNITAGTLYGVQLGVANIATHVRGVQIGLFNYYKESLNGFQLGLVNANPSTRVQLMIYGGNATKLNAGVRFKNELFYTILGMGTHYFDFSDKFSAAWSYRAGLELPLYKKLYISGDLGYQHIEGFKNKQHNLPARLYALQVRANLEYRITSQMGLFLTGGYGLSRHYTHNETYDKGAIVEGGIILFKY